MEADRLIILHRYMQVGLVWHDPEPARCPVPRSAMLRWNTTPDSVLVPIPGAPAAPSNMEERESTGVVLCLGGTVEVIYVRETVEEIEALWNGAKPPPGGEFMSSAQHTWVWKKDGVWNRGPVELLVRPSPGCFWVAFLENPEGAGAHWIGLHTTDLACAMERADWTTEQWVALDV